MVELQPPQLDAVFHALGDATRRRMLRELASGERTVGQLAEPFAISLAAASKHIKVLENAGLIRREVRGRTHLCRLDPGPLASAHQWLSFYERFWTDRLDVLERLLREEDARHIPHPRRRRPMTELATLDAYGVLTEPATLTIQRLLPGPIERVWAYLTESDLRRQWLAAGADGDEGRRAVRARLAQRRADRSARPAAGRLSRRASDAEPDHRARSAPQARLHLGRQRRRLLRAGADRATRCCSPSSIAACPTARRC